MNINLGINAPIQNANAGKGQKFDKGDLDSKGQDKSFKDVLGQEKPSRKDDKKVSLKKEPVSQDSEKVAVKKEAPYKRKSKDLETNQDNQVSEYQDQQMNQVDDSNTVEAKSNSNNEYQNNDFLVQSGDVDGFPSDTEYNPERIYNKISNGFVEKSNIDPLTRRASILSFMQKMKTDLNVSPVEMVGAFGSLSTEELSLPPEQTVAKVISKLGLTPLEKETALNHFSKMISQTESSSMAEYLKTNDKEISLEVLSKEELSQKQMQKSLSQLNSDFFVDNKAKAQQQLINKHNQFESSKNTTELGLNSLGNKEEASSDYGFKAMGAAAGLEQYSSKPGLAQANTLNSQMANAASLTEGQFATSKEMAGLNPNQSTSEALAFEQQLLGSDQNYFQLKSPNAMAAASVAAVGSETNVEVEGLSKNFSNEANLNQNVEGFSENNSEMNLAQDSGQDLEADQELDASELEGFAESFSNKLNKSEKAFSVGGKAQVTPADESQNVTEVIKTSKILIKEGGGEMKIKMTPEGLGEIDLKVNVKGDKVNVEMVASNKESQKILEKGLGDLKAQLASQKINVDQIKVDVSNDTMTDLNQKQQEENRQMAQQFMQDFRNNNQSFRNSMGGYAGREVKSQTEDTSEVQEILEAKRSQRPKSSGTLDLVA